jgi:hypothetical protein
MVGPAITTASVMSSGRGTPGGLVARRKAAGILGRSKALKVAIPGAARTEMYGRREGEQGVKGGSNFEDASCPGSGAPGSYGPFVLATAEGSETPGEEPRCLGHCVTVPSTWRRSPGKP